MVRVDDWTSRQPGRLELGKTWRLYPFEGRGGVKQPPAIVAVDGRRALSLATEGEAVRVGRTVVVDVRKKPWLVWEWKPLVLPDGADSRDRQRNDQAARLMVVFEGLKAVAYLWDTTAPVGTDVQPDEFEMFQRSFVVVRSGSDGIGRWDRQRRNIHQDYVRLFGEEPRPTKWVGFESHSDDTQTRSATLFGSASFESR